MYLQIIFLGRVKDHPGNSQFFYTSLWLLKIGRSPQNHLLRSKILSPSNLFHSLRSQSCSLTLSKSFSLSTTRWQMDPLFGERPWPRPTGSCHGKETSVATPGVQHPRRGQRHRPVESHDSLRRFSPDKGIDQSKLVSRDAWLTDLQRQIWRGVRIPWFGTWVLAGKPADIKKYPIL